MPPCRLSWLESCLVCCASSFVKRTKKDYTGSFVLGRLADKIGRKNCITISLVGVIFFNTTSAISTSYLMYVVAKLCVGFFLSGMILATFVLG